MAVTLVSMLARATGVVVQRGAGRLVAHTVAPAASTNAPRAAA